MHVAFFTFSYWPDPESEVDLTYLLRSFLEHILKTLVFFFFFLSNLEGYFTVLCQILNRKET